MQNAFVFTVSPTAEQIIESIIISDSYNTQYQGCPNKHFM